MSTGNVAAAGDSLGRARRIDLLCDRFEAAWHPAAPPAIEDFLGDAGPDRAAVLVELVRLELDYRRRAGHRPSREEYLARFPELAGAADSLWTASGEAPDGPDTATHPPGRTTLPDGVSPAVPAPGYRGLLAGRYELLGEIARGGMGVVHRASEPALGREVAVKTLHDHLKGSPTAARRFLAEARVTGQLQHPGIPPVFDVGSLPDGSPFLAMKLIRGRTLSAVLRDRFRRLPEPLPRLVSVFEAVCQTVGYAHSVGVLHRDLKTANVMVGAFGEVQVMDWGLAKVLGGGDEIGTGIREIGAAPRAAEVTQPGTVMGTAAYMPPEQARGETDRVDERADVFALGAILCELLTGEPPFAAPDSASALALAAAGDLGPVFARLDGCGADPELIALARRCLDPDRDARPRDAGAVAELAAAYRAGFEARLRASEVERAAAAARAEEEANTRRAAEGRAREERKRRRTQLALAASVGLLLAAGGGFAWWRDRQAAERNATEARLEGERDAEARNKADQARAGVRAGLTLAADLRKQYKFKAAEAALAQAADLARGGASELLPEVEQARDDLAFVVELDDIRYRKWVVISEPGRAGKFDRRVAAPEYRKSFADRGLDLTALDPGEAAARIATSAIKANLVAAVDDWALCTPEVDRGVRDRLLAVARRAYPGPWTDRLRDPALWEDRAAVAKLAGEADPATAPSAVMSVLAFLMWHNDLDPSPLLAAARARYPADFELAFALGLWRGRKGVDGREIVPYEAARALRPESTAVWVNLGAALHGMKDYVGSIAALREAIRLDPKLAMAHTNLGTVLHDTKDHGGAVAAHREAIRLDPKLAAAHTNLGAVLCDVKDYRGAIAACREAVRLAPTHAKAHNNLGDALRGTKDYGGAVAAYREAVRLDPTYAAAYLNLGAVLCDVKGDYDGAIAAFREAIRLDPKGAAAHTNLGNALRGKKDHGGSIAAHREAIRLDPKLAQAHLNLGVVLHDTKDLDGAVAAHREAVRLDPTYATAYNSLGLVLEDKRDHGGAVAAYREAVRLDPTYAAAHLNLGAALHDTKDLDGAIAAFREAIKHNPTYATAHNNLVAALMAKGDMDGATAACREAIKHNPKEARAYFNLGIVLKAKGDLDGEVAAYREAVKLDPKHPKAHYSLGVALRVKGDLDGAAAAYREAIRLDPGYPEAHCNLGHVLRSQGHLAEALPLFRKGHELGSKRPGWRYPSAKWVADCERELAAQEARTAPPPREVKR